MSAKHKSIARKSQPTSAPPTRGRARVWLLSAVAALCVARPLLPSEGVSWLGDGQPFDLLWMLLAAGYFLSALSRGGLARRPGLVDGAVLLLIVLSAASALVGAKHGSPRFAINMLWEWVAAGLVFFLVRQLVRTGVEARALVTLMVALAVVLASYGFYQVFIGLPADRAAYAANPDELLRSLGHWYPPGSPEREHFENRLQSSEPLATFALTNSLAGYLAPWLIMTLGIGVSWVANRRETAAGSGGQAQGAPSRSYLRFLAWSLYVLALSGCLVLTKSRSGYVAAAVGTLLLPICCGAVRRIWNWKLVAAGCAVVLALVIGAVLFKGLDAEVLTEIPKSLGFRWQYWQATAVMIKDHPWLGVGPGNFQDFYTQYKLPAASEEIRDPHNFLLEVWATSGTLAALALVMVLAGCAWRACRWASPISSLDGAPRETPTADIAAASWMVAGGAAGMLLAFFCAPAVGLVFSSERLASGLFVGCAVVATAWPWILSGSLPPRLPALGAAVLLINLLAAGGMAYPGVAGTLWILLALMLNGTEPIAEPPAASTAKSSGHWLAGVGLAASCMAAGACYFSAYEPVLRCRGAIANAEDDQRLSADALAALLIAAGAADPLSAEPWHALAELDLGRLQLDPTASQARREFVEATSRVLELRPRSSAAWRQVARWYWLLHEKQPSAADANTAAQCYQRAVELYPNFATLRGEYALALHATGKTADSVAQAAKALELDQATPHADKKLSPKLREQLAAFVRE